MNRKVYAVRARDSTQASCLGKHSPKWASRSILNVFYLQCLFTTFLRDPPFLLNYCWSENPIHRQKNIFLQNFWSTLPVNPIQCRHIWYNIWWPTFIFFPFVCLYLKASKNSFLLHIGAKVAGLPNCSFMLGIIPSPYASVTIYICKCFCFEEFSLY